MKPHPSDAPLTLRLDRWASIIRNEHAEDSFFEDGDEAMDLSTLLTAAANEISTIPPTVELREDAYGLYECPPFVTSWLGDNSGRVIVSATALFDLLQSYNSLRWAQYGDDL